MRAQAIQTTVGGHRAAPACRPSSGAASADGQRPSRAARIIRWGWCVAVALVQPAIADEPAAPRESDLRRFELTEVHMGADFRLVFYAPSQDGATIAARAAFDRVAALNRILSDYDPASELSRLCDTAGTGQAVRVSDDLGRVLARSQRLAEQSSGAFDVTVGPLTRLWRRARRQKEFPDPARLAEARAAVGFRHLRLDPEQGTVKLLRPGMRLDMGGIGMGYAADEALAVLRAHGVTHAMVDASGDVVVGAPPPGANAWRVAIPSRDGTQTLEVALAHAAVTVSGDLYQFVELNGRRYSHIVDPRTGLGLTDQSQVVVVAPDCATADSLATAISVLGPAEGLKLLGAYPGTAARVTRAVEGRFETVASPGFDRWLAPADDPADH